MLGDVARITDPSPTACTIAGNPSSSINSRDANECLEQIATAGIDCGFRCGNGLLDAGEGCDDGNNMPGDGCDASCQSE
jgi:cysteine-rich repeat protein